jgi:hypothetical protein
MKAKKILAVLAGILILCSFNSIAETKKLKEIGRYTLVRIKGEVPTSEVMKTLVDRYSGDIKYGFDLAGYGDLYLAFMEQIKAQKFTDGELAVGQPIPWMLFRSQGKIKIVKDLEWAGKGPLPIYVFTVQKDYKHYDFFMPKACGNISFLQVREVIPDAVCAIQVEPVKANINDPIHVDMSGSQHAMSMEVEVFGPDGQKVASKSLTPETPTWQAKFAEPGEYIFKAKALNPKGKASVNSCEAKTYINFPPVCKIWSSCMPCENYVGRPITFDASNSTDPDGDVEKVDFEIKDEMGGLVGTFSDTEKPFSLEKIFEKPGIYNITAVVTDDFGAMSEPCKIEDLEVTQKKLFIMAHMGPLFARGSYGSYLGGRLGLLYWLIPGKLDIQGSAGGMLALKGEPWKSFAMGDVLLNFHSGAFFFGGGGGFTTKVKEMRESDFDLLGNLGFDIFNNWTTIGSIYGQVRWPLGEDRSFSKNHKLELGFRLLF